MVYKCNTLTDGEKVMHLKGRFKTISETNISLNYFSVVYCGDIQFFHNKYTMFHAKELCPILNYPPPPVPLIFPFKPNMD